MERETERERDDIKGVGGIKKKKTDGIVQNTHGLINRGESSHGSTVQVKKKKKTNCLHISCSLLLNHAVTHSVAPRSSLGTERL